MKFEYVATTSRNNLTEKGRQWKLEAGQSQIDVARWLIILESLVILNPGQVTRTTAELAPPSPNYRTTPTALHRFNAHRSLTRCNGEFDGTSTEPYLFAEDVRLPELKGILLYGTEKEKKIKALVIPERTSLLTPRRMQCLPQNERYSIFAEEAIQFTDCPENIKNSINLNDPPETNAKHSHQASRDSKKIANPNTDGGFTSPKKVAKKIKLFDPIAGTSQPISVKNKFSSLAGKEANVTPPISNQTSDPNAARPKVPPIMLKHKKENYKTIIKDLNKDFPNCDVKLAGKYLKIFTTSTDEHRIVTLYLKEKCEEFYVINPPDSRPLKIVLKGLPVSTEIDEIKADLTSQGFRVEKVAQLTRSKTKSPLPIFMVELERNPDSPDIFQLKKCCYLAEQVDNFNFFFTKNDLQGALRALKGRYT
ncbi:uncharacterized protein TNCV_3205361 [Trichonephila clavipes]|nr:uncharacterized protein TNCV_3205361 [Trichonephila clavipes]